MVTYCLNEHDVMLTWCFDILMMVSFSILSPKLSIYNSKAIEKHWTVFGKNWLHVHFSLIVTLTMTSKEIIMLFTFLLNKCITIVAHYKILVLYSIKFFVNKNFVTIILFLSLFPLSCFSTFDLRQGPVLTLSCKGTEMQLGLWTEHISITLLVSAAWGGGCEVGVSPAWPVCLKLLQF